MHEKSKPPEESSPVSGVRWTPPESEHRTGTPQARLFLLLRKDLPSAEFVQLVFNQLVWAGERKILSTDFRGASSASRALLVGNMVLTLNQAARKVPSRYVAEPYVAR